MRLSLAELQQIVRYEPETGHFFWLQPAKGRRLGRPAGSMTARRGSPTYITISISGQNYQAHQLAWMFMTGVWPTHKLDHRNLDKQDNRWKNLREATTSQNGANAKARTQLPKGVTLRQDLRSKPFQARITFNQKIRTLGYFSTPEAASEAYLAAARQDFKEFARQ